MPRISSTTAVKQPSVANHRVRSKPAWSDYLTEDNRFALTKAEVLRRKKTLLSKNNVFNTVSKLPNGSAPFQNDHCNPSVKSRRSEVGDVRKAKTRSGEHTSHVDDDAMFSEKSQSPDALDFVSKKSICWEDGGDDDDDDDDDDYDDDELENRGGKENETTTLMGMTPSPENGTSSNRIINMNSVERTTEKYSGFYNMGKNVRETKNVNKKNRENCDDVDDKNENEDGNGEDTDDEFEMGILNLSNHDINDDDEVLQGVSYLTPPSKTITMTHSIKNNIKNSSKIHNKVSNTKGSILLENKSINNLQYKQNYLSVKTVKTPLKRFIIEKREVGNGRKEKYNNDHRLNDDKNVVNCAFMEGVKSDEMIEMTSQIKALTGELKYFEELTGKRCIFETKELQTALDNCSDINEMDGNQNLSSIAVMRYLVQLVCQSMTFLLRGEVEAHSLRSKYDQLEIKVDTLTKLLLPNNNNTNDNNNNTNNVHNNLNGMGCLGFGFGVGMGSGTGGYINPNYSSISNYTPPLAVTGNGNGTGQQGQGGGNEFYPHSVSDLNSTYMSAYMSYIQADTPTSGIKDLESQKSQQNGSDTKDMNGMAKSPLNSNLSDGSSQHRRYHTNDHNQPISQRVPSTPLPLPLSTPHRTTSVTTTNINNNERHTHNNTQNNTNTITNNNKSAHNGESNHGSISGTSTSDWLFACTPHKTPITSTTTNVGQNPGVNGGQNPGVNAPHSNVSQISMLESNQTPIVKSEYNKVNSMIMCNGFTKESLGSVRYEYDSPSMISITGNVPQSSDRSMSLQRRLFSQPSHFSLPADGNETLNSSHPHPLLHPSSHPSSNPSSHASSNPSTTATARTQSHILPSSHTTIQNTAQFPSSTLIKNTVSVYDNNSQINGTVSVTPYNDIRGIITKNLAQSFLDVDASLTQIEKSRNGYSTYTSPKGDEYDISEKENCEIQRNIPDNGTFFEGTRSQLPNSHYISSHRVPQSPALNSIPVDRYTVSPAISGQRGSTGGYPLDIPPPPQTTALDRHEIDGYTHSAKPNMHMSGDSNVKRDDTVHVPQGFHPPGPNPHSHYNPSPRKPSVPSFDVLNAPSSSYSRPSASHHSLIQSPSPSPSPTLANRPSTQPIPHQRSSSSISSTHRNTAVSSDNEQGSMCVPSCNVPLPSAPPNHPFSLENIEIPLFRSLNSGTNKPVYDARHGSFSRK